MRYGNARILALALGGLLLAIAGKPGKAATTIHFDQFEVPGSGFVIHPNPLDVGDYRFTSVDFSSAPLLTSFQQGSSFYNGSAALSCGNASDIELTRINGGAFDALSLDLDSWTGQHTIELTGTLAGGGTVQQVFTTDLAQGGQTVALSGFTNLISLRFDAAGSVPFSGIFGQLDNLQLALVSPIQLRNAELVAGGSPVLQNGSGTMLLEDARLGRIRTHEYVVPEPGAISQLGAGIGLLTLLVKRHSSRGRTQS